MADFFDMNFWKPLVASLVATGVLGAVFGYLLRYLLDSRMERQKTELAKELFETQVITQVKIQSQIEGIDNLLKATLAFRDAVSNFMAEVKGTREIVEGLRRRLDKFHLARSLGPANAQEIEDLTSEVETSTETIKQKSETMVALFLPWLTEYFNAVSYAKARMSNEQRERLKPLNARIFSEIIKLNEGNPHEAIGELRKYLEAESRRLRRIEEGKT